MNDKDFARFEHMQDSARFIVSCSQGRKKSDLETDRQFLGVVLREFTVLGEAAAQISNPTRKEFPSIPWKEIISMRNRLVHGYFDLNHDIIWSSIQHDLPHLCQKLEQIILSIALKV